MLYSFTALTFVLVTNLIQGRITVYVGRDFYTNILKALEYYKEIFSYKNVYLFHTT
jgi:hypothetical protein